MWDGTRLFGLLKMLLVRRVLYNIYHERPTQPVEVSKMLAGETVVLTRLRVLLCCGAHSWRYDSLA